MIRSLRSTAPFTVTPPFVWQTELLKRVAAHGWPGTIAMPTSSGKTSAIDVAVFHLAMEAGKSALERRAPLRIFFIVDRRIVVDEAYDHARKIALRLRDAEDGILLEVASRLRSFGGAVPLQVSKMRGGMLRDNGWADEPNQPTVCLSTVDQVGSRLLFRGYQVGERSRSVHAGLVGNDSLLILDEAHLVERLSSDLRGRNRKICGVGGNSSSATPDGCAGCRQRRMVKAFSISEPEWVELDAEVLGKRLRASKPAELRETKKRFEDDMAAAAKELGTSVQAGVVGVIANTVGSAREIFNKINGDKVLLIGRNRPWMAEKLWDKHKDRIAARWGRKREGLLYVVATQTVEVGANIDFDALISESAPMDSLRQRFGRLNRLGRGWSGSCDYYPSPEGGPRLWRADKDGVGVSDCAPACRFRRTFDERYAGRHRPRRPCRDEFNTLASSFDVSIASGMVGANESRARTESRCCAVSPWSRRAGCRRRADCLARRPGDGEWRLVPGRRRVDASGAAGISRRCPWGPFDAGFANRRRRLRILKASNSKGPRKRRGPLGGRCSDGVPEGRRRNLQTTIARATRLWCRHPMVEWISMAGIPGWSPLRMPISPTR